MRDHLTKLEKTFNIAQSVGNCNVQLEHKSDALINSLSNKDEYHPHHLVILYYSLDQLN